MRRLLTLLLACSLVAGCITPVQDASIDVVGQAFEVYKSQREYFTGGENVIAMVSYAAAALAATDRNPSSTSVDVVRAYFKEVEDKGIIHDNYPVPPLPQETLAALSLINLWQVDAYIVSDSVAQTQLVQFMHGFIASVQDYEYGLRSEVIDE